jgi:hypothetical protein
MSCTREDPHWPAFHLTKGGAAMKRSIIRVTMTDQNDTQRLLQFANGEQIAGLQINALSDNLSHVMISSAQSGKQQDAAALILDRILKLCAQLNVECSRA